MASNVIGNTTMEWMLSKVRRHSMTLLGGVAACATAYWLLRRKSLSNINTKDSIRISIQNFSSGKIPSNCRVRTPFGYGYFIEQTEKGLIKVNLPNKATGFLNPSDVVNVDNEPIFVRTPFGLGELIHPKQTEADLSPDKDGLFSVKLEFGIARLNSESIRIANFDPHPEVMTPYGVGVLIHPPQPSYFSSSFITNKDNQLVIQVSRTATLFLNPQSVQRLNRSQLIG